MQAHPSYPALAHVLPKYPRAAGSIFQAYNDIVLVQQWTEIELIDLEGISRAAISGKKPKTDIISYVVPCSLAETVSFGWLTAAFALLSNPQEIYLAITSDDASIVYYKLSRGIVKPQV
ncbi:Sen15 domain-containing protein [Favolaschia claudopus]|uniref:Sen15 domain-containing protein n=1 Tax=Favolaschia claudopus TaxID=2862362 RepID=A0AAW0BA42_9AGAR